MEQTRTNPMQCGDFETVLTEAVEGKLAEPAMQQFKAHAADCKLCGPMFAEALAGYQFVRSLPEMEAPDALMHNILAATTGVTPRAAKSAERHASASAWQRMKESMAGFMVPMMQPRIAGTFAMAFFSISLLLNLAGFKVADLKHADLRPGAVKVSLQRHYYETSARVLKYYDSMRFVYEVESRLRAIKSVTTTEEQTQQPKEKKPAQQKQNQNQNQNMSNRPDQQQEQDHYAQQAAGGVVEVNYYMYNNAAVQPSLDRRRMRRLA